MLEVIVVARRQSGQAAAARAKWLFHRLAWRWRSSTRTISIGGVIGGGNGAERRRGK